MRNEDKWSIEELTRTLKKSAETDRDNLIILDGLTGTGKSTLGLKMCIKGCEWFDMDKDILYSQDEIIEWVTAARPGSWGLADEAVNALFKRDFAGKKQKFLLKILDMCRDRNLTLIMCIPNFWALDKHLLEGRTKFRIHVGSTGLAYMWKPSGSPFAPDKWYRKYNEKVCWNWDRYQNVKKTKGFMGFIKFGDLAEGYKQKYLKIKKEKKEMIKRMEEEAERSEDEAKTRSVKLGETALLYQLRKEGLLKKGALAMLAELNGTSRQALNGRLREYGKRISSDNGNVSEVNEINNNKEYINYTIKEVNHGNSQLDSP